MRLQVRPSQNQTVKNSLASQVQAIHGKMKGSGMMGDQASGIQNNLYIQGLPKELAGGETSITAFRRIFARFGKIQSFKLVNDPKFATNLAYAHYKHPS